MIRRKVTTRIRAKGQGPTGQTNSFNPTTLSQLNDAYAAMTRAQGVVMVQVPPEPQKTMPGIDARYINMGKGLGICPYELRDLMQAEIGEDQTLVFSLLKKFISAAKLSGAVDLSKTHKTLRDCEDRYQSHHKDWVARKRSILQGNKSVQAEIKKKEEAFQAEWIKILIDLQTKLDRNSDLASLGEWDRLMTIAISVQGDNFCKITKNEAKLDFNACKKMDSKNIVDLPHIAGVIKKQEEEVVWQKWIEGASVNTLLKELWSFGLDFDDDEGHKREQIEWAIIAKSGKIPVRDRHGNLDWHATFRDQQAGDDLDPIWAYEENERKARALEALDAYKRSKVIKVKSGSSDW